MALLLVGGWSIAGTATVSGRISYISAETIFISIGTRDGLASGDSLSVLRDGEYFGKLVADHVSEKTASALPVVGGLALYKVDDTVQFVREDGRRESQTVQTAKQRKRTATEKRTGNRLLSQRSGPHSRVAFQLNSLSSGGSGSRTYTRPALLLESTSSSIGDAPVQHSLLMRMNNTLGNVRGVADASTRIYHAWAGISLARPVSFGIRIGRVDVPMVGSVGLVDGAMLTAGLPKGLEVGVLAGRTPLLVLLHPLLQLDGVRSEGSKTGVLISDQSGAWGDVLYQGGLAYVRESVNAGLDREWVAHESHLAVGRLVSAGMGMELDLAAADSASPNGTTQLSNFWTNVRVHVSRDISWGVRLNAIKFVKRLETYRSVPDSLWDSAQRFGVFTDARIRSGAATWSFGGGINTKAQTSMMMFSAWARYDNSRPFFGDRAGGNFRFVHNLFVDAGGFEVYDEMDFSRTLSGRVLAGFWAYGYGDANIRWLVRPRLEVETFWSPVPSWYLTASLGYEADPDAPVAYSFVELSRRF